MQTVNEKFVIFDNIWLYFPTGYKAGHNHHVLNIIPDNLE